LYRMVSSEHYIKPLGPHSYASLHHCIVTSNLLHWTDTAANKGQAACNTRKPCVGVR
jgi:hypothetical protein